MYTDSAMDGEQKPADAPDFTLHPVRGVVWAAFWGTFIAAGIVLAINYWRLGRTTAAQVTVAGSVVATAALLAIVLVIPDDLNIPNFLYWVPQLVAVFGIANSLQGESIERHIRRGGSVASAWPSVGIGILCALLVFAPLVGLVLLLEPSYETVVEFGDDDVYYWGDATADDARKLARTLEEMEFFGEGGASVGLEITSGEYTISFILIEDAWSDPETVDVFREIGRMLIESGYPAPLTIELCDDEFGVHKTIVVR